MCFLYYSENAHQCQKQDIKKCAAQFPTAFISVNMIGYKCCLQNVIKTLTLCLI